MQLTALRQLSDMVLLDVKNDRRDERALVLSSQLLKKIPDLYTVWNYRKRATAPLFEVDPCKELSFLTEYCQGRARQLRLLCTAGRGASHCCCPCCRRVEAHGGCTAREPQVLFGLAPQALGHAYGPHADFSRGAACRQVISHPASN